MKVIVPVAVTILKPVVTKKGVAFSLEDWHGFSCFVVPVAVVFKRLEPLPHPIETLLGANGGARSAKFHPTDTQKKVPHKKNQPK
eukprot:2276980-Amphidinium_carterae.1